ncbi:MAG: YqgE/AlgH family protein [Rhodospirillales bacterium]|nr:YqgE/AlgH family protein [Rhodospirillales bacterium]
MAHSLKIPTYLTGHLLIAMPQMQDPRFERSVIYMCAHNSDGAMGLVVNKLFDQLSFPDLLEQLNIETGPRTEQIRVHFGGPVESGRGFVLHSDDYVRDGTLKVESGFALTATVDILRAIAVGEGPRNSLLALGYAGWGPGQLETEIVANGWLTIPADEKLVFGADLDGRWRDALAKIGVELGALSGQAGHA